MMRLYTCKNGLSLMKGDTRFWAWTEEADEYKEEEIDGRNPIEVPEEAMEQDPDRPTSYRIIRPDLCTAVTGE